MKTADELANLADSAITDEFDYWWATVGSGITPRPADDMESHARRIAEISWRHAAHYGIRFYQTNK